MIGIVNYGLGNIASVVNMLDHLSVDARILDGPGDWSDIDRFILPGVGSFDRGMKGLTSSGLASALKHAVVDDGRPLLGICLGMQLLTRRSDEGLSPGLAWVPADTVKLQPRPTERVPHMGWREVHVNRNNELITLDNNPRFYFVHGFGVQCDNPKHVVAHVDYAQGFCACFQVGRIYGVQFHPEKSHRFGLDLLQRFASITA